KAEEGAVLGGRKIPRVDHGRGRADLARPRDVPHRRPNLVGRRPPRRREPRLEAFHPGMFEEAPSPGHGDPPWPQSPARRLRHIILYFDESRPVLDRAVGLARPISGAVPRNPHRLPCPPTRCGPAFLPRSRWWAAR